MEKTAEVQSSQREVEYLRSPRAIRERCGQILALVNEGKLLSLIQHKLTLMGNAETSTTKFRNLLKEISLLLGYEVTRSLPLKYEEIKTPLAPMNAPVLANLNNHLTTRKDLHRCQDFLKKFLACNQTSSTGLSPVSWI